MLVPTSHCNSHFQGRRMNLRCCGGYSDGASLGCLPRTGTQPSATGESGLLTPLQQHSTLCLCLFTQNDTLLPFQVELPTTAEGLEVPDVSIRRHSNKSSSKLQIWLLPDYFELLELTDHEQGEEFPSWQRWLGEAEGSASRSGGPWGCPVYYTPCFRVIHEQSSNEW